MEVISKGKYNFLRYKIGKAVFVFSTGENDISYDFRKEENAQVLEDMKSIFDLQDIAYLNQIHGTDISIYGDGRKQGDGIVTDRHNTAVGVFTADCVPVLLYDMDKQICAAVHSGWKGTYHKVTVEALKIMKEHYGTSMQDVHAIIGPHMGGCCYEVGEEVINLFKNDSLYHDKQIVKDSKLDMEQCIKIQLESEGVKGERIITTGFCTYCSNKVKFHSYRRDKDSSGRMFSFVYRSEK